MKLLFYNFQDMIKYIRMTILAYEKEGFNK